MIWRLGVVVQISSLDGERKNRQRSPVVSELKKAFMSWHNRTFHLAIKVVFLSPIATEDIQNLRFMFHESSDMVYRLASSAFMLRSGESRVRLPVSEILDILLGSKNPGSLDKRCTIYNKFLLDISASSRETHFQKAKAFVVLMKGMKLGV
jgi:hypothetical protein